MCERYRQLQHELAELRMNFEKEKSENILLKLKMVKMKPEPAPFYYSISEISEIFQVSCAIIRRLINIGQMSTLKVSDGKGSDWQVSHANLAVMKD